jgi:hypothetical protein
VKWDPYTADNFTTMRGAIEAADTAWVDVLKIDIEGALLKTRLPVHQAHYHAMTASQGCWTRAGSMVASPTEETA